MSKIAVVLVGIGGYGASYLRKLLSEEPGEVAEIKGVVDVCPEKSLYFKEVKERNIKVYADLASFYKENKADLAVISTPTMFHTAQIIECMENGSDVLCEKPLCGDIKDIDVLKEAQKRTNKFLMIGYQMSTNPPIVELKKDIAENMYGNVKRMKMLLLWPRLKTYYTESWKGRKYTASGEILYDSIANNAGAHYLHNLTDVIFDDENPDKVMPVEISAEMARANEIENFDTTVIKLKFANSAEAYFIGSHATKETIGPVFCYEFENGKVFSVNNSVESNKSAIGELGDVVGVLNDGTVKNYGNPFNHGDKLSVAIRLVKGEKLTYCTLENAAVQTKIIDYIQSNYEIMTMSDTYMENGYVVKAGLGETLLEIYNNPQSGMLTEFAKGGA